MIKFDGLDNIFQLNKKSVVEDIKENILVELKDYIENILKGLVFYWEDIILNSEGDYIMIDAYIICPKLRGFRKKIFSIQVKDNFEYPVIFIDEINDSSKDIKCEEELLFKINNFLKDEKVMIILKGLLKDNDESIF